MDFTQAPMKPLNTDNDRDEAEEAAKKLTGKMRLATARRNRG